nr:MAG TPA: hypothetical protein [Caudoviricetes sp.]
MKLLVVKAALSHEITSCEGLMGWLFHLGTHEIAGLHVA